MTAEIRVAEASDGINHLIIITQEGLSTPENLTGYTSAIMTITELDRITVVATITLAITDAVNGQITYTTSIAHSLPTVTAGEIELQKKAQIKITGTNLKDITKLIDFYIDNDISN